MSVGRKREFCTSRIKTVRKQGWLFLKRGRDLRIRHWWQCSADSDLQWRQNLFRTRPRLFCGLPCPCFSLISQTGYLQSGAPMDGLLKGLDGKGVAWLGNLNGVRMGFWRRWDMNNWVGNEGSSLYWSFFR